MRVPPRGGFATSGWEPRDAGAGRNGFHREEVFRRVVGAGPTDELQVTSEGDARKGRFRRPRRNRAERRPVIRRLAARKHPTLAAALRPIKRTETRAPPSYAAVHGLKFGLSGSDPVLSARRHGASDAAQARALLRSLRPLPLSQVTSPAGCGARMATTSCAAKATRTSLLTANGANQVV